MIRVTEYDDVDSSRWSDFGAEGETRDHPVSNDPVCGAVFVKVEGGCVDVHLCVPFNRSDCFEISVLLIFPTYGFFGTQNTGGIVT